MEKEFTIIISGEIYEGEMKNNKKGGKGIYYYLNGDTLLYFNFF